MWRVRPIRFLAKGETVRTKREQQHAQQPQPFDWLAEMGSGAEIVERHPRLQACRAEKARTTKAAEEGEAVVESIRQRLEQLGTPRTAAALSEHRTLTTELDSATAALQELRAAEHDAARAHTSAWNLALLEALVVIYDAYERAALEMEAALLAGAKAQLGLVRARDLAARLPIDPAVRARLAFESTELSRRDFSLESIETWRLLRPTDGRKRTDAA